MGALEVALLARHEQRRGAVVPGSFDRRASSEKQPDDVDVALLARHEQRRGAILLGLVDRRASIDKQPDDLERQEEFNQSGKKNMLQAGQGGQPSRLHV